jgi:uncharacterized membrane protein YbhN (UPF0104 family)
VKQHLKTWVKRLVPVAKLLAFALLCWFIYYTFVSGNDALNTHSWHVEPQWLVLAGVLYQLGCLPAALFWHRVLLHAGQEVGLFESLRAYYVSQLGKYVPGKLMVIVLRRTLLHSPAAENTVVAASVFFETFVMLAVGGALSTVLLLLWYRDEWLLIAAAIGSTLLVGVPTIPRVFGWLIGVLGVGKLNPTVREKLTRMGPRAILTGWISIAVGWTIQGMSFWATLRAMGEATGNPFENLALHTAAVSLGVVAGFISQIPGGLGMREWVSARLVEPQYGPSVAIVSAIIFRLMLLVSELVVSIILYAAGWRRGRKPAAVVEGG